MTCSPPSKLQSLLTLSPSCGTAPIASPELRPCSGHACVRAQLDNVLLQRQPDGKLAVKLCDFGYSKELVAWSNCKTRCGTPEYVAPEVNPRPERSPLSGTPPARSLLG